NVHLIVDLQKNLRSRFYCSAISKLTGAPVFTWNKEGMRRSRLIVQARLWGRTRKIAPKSLAPRQFKYEMMLEPLRSALRHHLPEDLLDGIGGPATPRLPTGQDEGLRPWQKELKFGNWIAVGPGASYPTKKAPEDLFLSILDRLRTR